MNTRLVVTVWLVMLWIVLYVIERCLVSKICEQRGLGALKGTITFFILNNLWHRSRNYIPQHSALDCFLLDFWNVTIGAAMGYCGNKVEQFDTWLEGKFNK